MKTLKGLKETIQTLEKFEKEMQKKIDDVTYQNAIDLQKTAKQKAPKDLGDLAQSITIAKGINQKYKASYVVIANGTGLAPYAAFQEFGTGGRVSVPSELADIASSFKGKKMSTFKEGLENIKDWCKNKGIDVKAAYPIFMAILKNGIEPKPYMYPALVRQRRIFLEDLKHLLETETKKV